MGSRTAADKKPRDGRSPYFWHKPDELVTCPECNGTGITGSVIVYCQDPYNYDDQREPCFPCGGTGKVTMREAMSMQMSRVARRLS